jgi:Lrp/AsnC family transcriptional regulator, leucine-responsive regulatory protein
VRDDDRKAEDLYHRRAGAREHIRKFQDGARKAPEIVECHHVTGTFDYLLRVEVEDLPAYERFHADCLSDLHNVGRLVTYISMADFFDD